MKIIYTLMAITFLLIFSCTENEPMIDNELEGTWIIYDYSFPLYVPTGQINYHIFFSELTFNEESSGYLILTKNKAVGTATIVEGSSTIVESSNDEHAMTWSIESNILSIAIVDNPDLPDEFEYVYEVKNDTLTWNGETYYKNL